MNLKGEQRMTNFALPDEGPDYQQRRAELLQAEIALKDQIEQVAALRRQLPLGKLMPEYTFREGPADLNRNDPRDMRDVTLSELFTHGHDTLNVDHLMFGAADDTPCVMCSMWADGYNAIAPHVEQRASFVLVAKAEIIKLRAWARLRGWHRLRLLSSYDSTFNRDMGMESAGGQQHPGLSVFTRAPGGAIYHRYTIGANFDEQNNRGIDLNTPVWNLVDLLPMGCGDWYPAHDYLVRPSPAATG
jgi:predicted dithiol-disulfide oxidoreductase (DUF899 family)